MAGWRSAHGGSRSQRRSSPTRRQRRGHGRIPPRASCSLLPPSGGAHPDVRRRAQSWSGPASAQIRAPVSIANICGALADAGLSGGSRPASPSAGASRTRGAHWPASTSPGVLRSIAQPARGSRRRSSSPGSRPRHTPARHDGRQPVQLSSGSVAGCRCASTAPEGRPGLTPTTNQRRLAGLTTLPRATRKAHATVDELMADIVEIRRCGYASTTSRPEGVAVMGSWSRAASPAGRTMRGEHHAAQGARHGGAGARPSSPTRRGSPPSYPTRSGATDNRYAASAAPPNTAARSSSTSRP